MVKWKTEEILEGKKPDSIISEVQQKVERFAGYREKLDDMTPEEIRKVILLEEDISKQFKKVNAYYGLKFSEKTDDPRILAKMSKLEQLGADIQNKMMFFSLWYMHLDDGKAKEISEANEDYAYYLHQIRKSKPYTKSEEVEQIISLKSITGRNAFSNLYDVLTNNFEFNFDGEEGLSQEEVTKHFRDDDPKKREEAYKTVLGKYGDNKTVLTEIYKNIATDWMTEGLKIRGHKGTISIRNFYNDIEDEVVETMLKVIRKNSGLFQEFFKTVHDMIGNYPYSRYHIYAPYSPVQKEYPYEQSRQTVLETFKQFDERFYEAAKEIFDKGHVHSHPKPKKRSGAFCYSVHNEATPYILLNHTDSLRDLFTMMHEFGHGVHGVMARDQVDLLYSTSTPMAETASVFAEMLLASRILDESESDDEKKSILVYLLSNQYATIMRQAYFTIWEETAHKLIKEGATKDELDSAYMENLKEQFGDMEIPDDFRNEWNYVSHFHFAPFYCYAYSWGNLLVLSLYHMYKEEGDEFVDKYVNLLSEGGGKSPQELLEEIGIDPSKEEFWQGGFDVIKQEIDMLKNLEQ